jgi:hypothetical protein
MKNRDKSKRSTPSYKTILMGALLLMDPLGIYASTSRNLNEPDVRFNVKTLDQLNVTYVSQLEISYPQLVNNTIELPVYNLTYYNDWICTRKKHGSTFGEICKTISDGVSYFTKVIQSSESDKLQSLGQNGPEKILQNPYNIHFAETNFKVVLPEYILIAKSSNIYFASRQIPDFTMGLNFVNLPSYNETNFRKEIVKKIGEEGISEHTAASFFLSDLDRVDNWGVANGKLALVDIDNGHFVLKDIQRFFHLAKRALAYATNENVLQHIKKNGIVNRTLVRVKFALTLNNIQQMKATFERMAKIPLEPLHDSVNMLSQTDYASLLQIYIMSADQAIQAIKKTGIDPSEPNRKNNAHFLEAINSVTSNRDTLLQKPKANNETSTTMVNNFLNSPTPVANKTVVTVAKIRPAQRPLKVEKESSGYVNQIALQFGGIGVVLCGIFAYAFKGRQQKNKPQTPEEQVVNPPKSQKYKV